MWNEYHQLECCQSCGTTKHKHFAKGFCRRCYHRNFVPAQWSRKHSRCVKCGTDQIKHVAHGLCRRCYGSTKDSGPPCACGCGLPVSLRAGKPKKFRKGHWVRAQGPNSEFQQMMSRRFSGEGNPCYGLYGEDHPSYGHETTEETRELRRQHGLNLVKKRWNDKTDIEIILSDLLDELHLYHISQYVVGNKFIVDELLPEFNVIIEAWGDFWHANPARFDIDELTEVQRKNCIRDASRLKYIRKCGYTVLTFWEYDLKNNLDHCRSQILDTLGIPPSQLNAPRQMQFFANQTAV